MLVELEDGRLAVDAVVEQALVVAHFADNLAVFADNLDGGLAVGAVAPTTLDSSSGLSTSFGLILLIALFVIALVVGPAIAWQRFSGRGNR